MMPVLAPSGVQDYLDLGLHGWAMSRYSGCWVAFKAVADTIVIVGLGLHVDPHARRHRAARPTSRCRRAASTSAGRTTAGAGGSACCTTSSTPPSPMPAPTGSTASSSTARIRGWASSPAASPTSTCARPSTTSASTTGSPPRSASASTRSAWCGRSNPRACAQFAEGLEEILVVEEKRQLIEYQLKEELYNWREDVRPRVIGKFDEKGEWAQPHGDWLLPAAAS
jgi:indolepyruvate ferredoxin oxidoreductase